MPYAKLPFKTLIQPAIDLEEKGFTLAPGEASSLNYIKNDLIKMNKVAPVFVKETPWKTGDTLVQKDLANTIKRIRDLGAKGFYEGETAKLIAEQMKKDHGIITEDDLKNYKAKNRAPIVFDYKGTTVVSMPL